MSSAYSAGQGLSTPHAQTFSRHANAVGADAVIAMAPYVQALLDEDAVVDYYQGISDVVDIPVFIQNHALEVSVLDI